MKPCKKCGVVKPLSEFHIAKAMREGHRNECKTCWSSLQRARYQRNRDAVIKRTQEWRRSHPDKYQAWLKKNRDRNRERLARQNRAGHLQRKYGLSPEDFEFLVITQGGACRICHKVEGDKLHVDHDHVTGLIRGLLCGNCNKAIGLFEEDADRFAAATSYLRETQLPLTCGDRPRKRTRVVRR